jgi:hypothetical protein
LQKRLRQRGRPSQVAAHPQGPTDKSWFLLEQQQIFSQSHLWDIQRQYFSAKGVEAWRQDEVPSYITSNPTIAHSYAEIVFAFWCEQQRLARSDEPLYLCELGAGSGRFAFHFLQRLTLLCEQAGIALTSFCYVLTDFTQSNLDFWQGHPRLRPFFEQGVADMALFDIVHSDQLTLQGSGKTITTDSLTHPVVIIANYVFDSVPQDLYYIADQRCQQCLISLLFDEDPQTLALSEVFDHLHWRFDLQASTAAPYQETYLQDLLCDYQRTLTDTYLFFPAVGLRCLQRLKEWSKQGLLVLSADKGSQHLWALEGHGLPTLVHHGSFSLMVNYHAFKAFCEQSGGVALFPDHDHRSVNVSCLFLLGEASSSYRETQRAYQRHVQGFGPDDFYTLIRHVRQSIAGMSVEEILVCLRFSLYDSHQFTYYLPRLLELAPALEHEERERASNAIERVWEGYFPLGEPLDQAYQIACFFYAIDDYRRALTFFERSLEIYGRHSGTLYNIAVCYQFLEQHEQARQLLVTVLHYDPENQQAREALAAYEAAEQERPEQALPEDPSSLQGVSPEEA